VTVIVIASTGDIKVGQKPPSPASTIAERDKPKTVRDVEATLNKDSRAGLSKQLLQQIGGVMKTTITKRRVAFLFITVTTLVALAGVVVLATPGSGVVGTILARSSFTDPVDIKFKLQDGQRQEIIQVNNTRDTVMQQIVIAAGGTTGWHSHPGPAVALIKTGELTLYSSEDPTCTGRTYAAGQAFVDSGQGHVHIARNLTQSPTEVWVTYFDVPPGESVRIDAPDPGVCGF